MDLDSMKYADLRGIAKELGLKANMKADKLLKAIKQHYEEKNKQKEKQEQENDVSVVEETPAAQDTTQENKEAACQEVSSTNVFVNTRRGKGNGTKRKISDTPEVTESEEKSPPSAAEESCEPSDTRGAKKRKVSSAKDQTEADPPEENQTSDNKDEATVTKISLPLSFSKAPKVAKTGRIPRYQGSQQKNKPPLKPVTPNFKKLHEAHFNKMESIDSYVQRKTKQMETLKNSVKELKNLVDKTKMKQVESKTQARANASRTSMFSPAPTGKKAAEERRRHTLLSASKAPKNKPAVKEDAPFRPSVLSTRRINVRFSEATYDNEHKRSMIKTPARMSPCVASSTPQKQAADAGKPNNAKPLALSATKTPAAFVFTGNTSTTVTPGTQKKPAFDLKASLSRPLGYKPHTGKLKPFGETNENTAANKSLILNSHQKNYKQHQVQTRGDRRAKQAEERKHKKENILGARRGLVMM
ncbi:nucleolar and spindle-associated protein 1 isoform X2 [Xyrichtys novacula]|uniref:Nucleolar and spindle-associated protein 1 isoform X2 n=1 Tax=Xyrichtys novacula TaxID=13765 RepID=A0AAV1GQY7_XYRNO|nr:nucleolar and spindle-associated protein 1 isoform X2 [Xyrichtys novacula]